ncbi:MAG: hypothetical protein M3143_08990 [Actinomycetota bacterium]|nr:hypothetical protein [Actinomycetota bacterium]
MTNPSSECIVFAAGHYLRTDGARRELATTDGRQITLRRTSGAACSYRPDAKPVPAASTPRCAPNIVVNAHQIATPADFTQAFEVRSVLTC